MLPNAEFLVYPNPNQGTFNLKFEELSSREIQIKVFDMKGQNVYSQNLTSSNGTYLEQIDLFQNHSGIYLIKIETNQSVYMVKVNVIK